MKCSWAPLVRKFFNPSGCHVMSVHPSVRKYLYVNQCEMSPCNLFPSFFPLEIERSRFTGYMFDIGHPCYVQLTPIKKGIRRQV